MAARRSDEEREGLARALAGVKPLAGGVPRVRPRPAKPAPGARPPEAHDDEATLPGDAPGFAVESSGEHVEGLAQGIDRAWLRRLRAGEIAPEARVDLHGQRARDASRSVRRALDAAYAAGHRCVLVVHGRGTRSAEGAVLRAELPRWLADPRTAPLVMAFATARPADGGTGATYVLLRRKR